MPRFACRTCRREVALEGGATNHLDGSPACVMSINGTPLPDYDKHEPVHDEGTLVPEPISIPKKKGKRVVKSIKRKKVK